MLGAPRGELNSRWKIWTALLEAAEWQAILCHALRSGGDEQEGMLILSDLDSVITRLRGELQLMVSLASTLTTKTQMLVGEGSLKLAESTLAELQEADQARKDMQWELEWITCFT